MYLNTYYYILLYVQICINHGIYIDLHNIYSTIHVFMVTPTSGSCHHAKPGRQDASAGELNSTNPSSQRIIQTPKENCLRSRLACPVKKQGILSHHHSRYNDCTPISWNDSHIAVTYEFAFQPGSRPVSSWKLHVKPSQPLSAKAQSTVFAKRGGKGDFLKPGLGCLGCGCHHHPGHGLVEGHGCGHHCHRCHCFQHAKNIKEGCINRHVVSFC